MNTLFVEVKLFNLYETPLPFYSPDEIFNRHDARAQLSVDGGGWHYFDDTRVPRRDERSLEERIGSFGTDAFLR